MIGSYATSKYTFDLHPEDVYLCTADCGWITGRSFPPGIFHRKTRLENGTNHGKTKRKPWENGDLASGKRLQNYVFFFLMGKGTISMAMASIYVERPERKISLSQNVVNDTKPCPAQSFAIFGGVALRSFP